MVVPLVSVAFSVCDANGVCGAYVSAVYVVPILSMVS